MLTETARVVALEGDSVWVETLRQSSCGACAARSGCGHGMINSAKAGVSQGLIKALLPLDSGLTVSLHDTVEIAIPERGFLRAAWMLYAMPLLMTVLAAVVADQLFSSAALSQAAADLRVTLAAIAGLAGGLLILRAVSRRMSHDPDIQPRVTGVS
ncbi:SoxR reducing system RseC family protein [Congregibacter variabilis]|uniref:SoxR reducing system RseC family protein n=1 Tax=Congregibacter variabilis TaxID=3081200 RepID=A0ABZ0I523_9GAMM|nr:SoxR reducing system RseC family protein [Congregibacter sp. IMCC43200]